MAIAKIIQGEQYAIEIVLTADGTAITPNNSDDVKIRIDGVEKTYSSGELTYEDGRWLFPITQVDSLRMSTKGVKAQAQYKVGSNVFSTEIYDVEIDPSVIRSVFSGT